MEQAHHGPEGGVVPVAQLPGVPVHDALHRQRVLDVKGLLVILPQQVQRLLTAQLLFHGRILRKKIFYCIHRDSSCIS